MFLEQPLRHDTRVEKEATTLTAAGYEVTIIAALSGPAARGAARRRADRACRRGSAGGAARPRIVARRSRGAAGPPGTVITRESVDRGGARAQLLRIALRVHLRLSASRWSRNALAAAADARAALWIAHDLETVPTALKARDRLGGAVLYDSHEFFTDSPLTRGAARRWVRVERRCIGRADAVTTVSGGRAAARRALRRARARGPDERPARRRRSRTVSRSTCAASCGCPRGRESSSISAAVQQLRGLDLMIRAIAQRPDLALVMMVLARPNTARSSRPSRRTKG